MKPIDRLKKQYTELKESEIKYNLGGSLFTKEQLYNSARLFALDCNLVSFNDVELMEFEVKEEFKNK